MKTTASTLNKETKIFFLILFFVFLVGMLFVKIESFFTYYILSMIIGAIIGFLFLYSWGYIEIHKGTEKITWKKRPSLKEIKKGYIGYFLGGIVILLTMGLMCGPGTFSLFFIAGTLGALIIPPSYFYTVKRLNAYTEEHP